MALWTMLQTEPLTVPLGGGMFRAIVGTALVLGILFLLAFLLRRGVLTLPGQRGSRTLSIETALSLGDRRTVAILCVEGRRLLVGLTPVQISVLAELDTPQGGFDQALDRATSPAPVKPL
ncbi:MAG: flagellar biosynthetic protein FliO [Vicinamibacterales bacterium]|nr:flagellar biosynthetic protein FliO [Vicinamibacterales bacterium]